LTVETAVLYGFQHFVQKSGIIVETMRFQELGADQRRETVNTRQRFDAWNDARQRLDGYRGSMVWAKSKDTEYLRRSYYVASAGRKQTSLGPRSRKTEKLKQDFDTGRDDARRRFADLDKTLARQSAINRAIGLGRVPLLGARIIRALDAAGLLGQVIRIVGTNAIYAYEAVAGILVEPGLTTTEDIDLLFDARHQARFTGSMPVSERTLLAILRRVDRSFDKDTQAFRAVNASGYRVDFIKPMPVPPWRKQPEKLRAQSDDLAAVAIDGLGWLEDSPPFEAVTIDERGAPLRMVVPDPRAFAIHKNWLAERADRDPVKRRRDREQAKAVADIVTQHLIHLPFDAKELSAIPVELLDQARPLFGARS
jgi:hypothetical protein